MAPQAARTWVALVHHPVLDRTGRVVSTALTTLDLHDIARASLTYGLAGFLVVHPVDAQRALAERILRHYGGDGDAQNDFRRRAFEQVELAASLEEARARVAAQAGLPPRLVGTTARARPGQVPAAELPGEVPLLIVLGTGWGLTEEVLETCDHLLAPIRGPTDYNHLSVRSACAILLDRAFGDRPRYAPSDGGP
jgi:tRNA (guanine37-N1)-methyltransferase